MRGELDEAEKVLSHRSVTSAFVTGEADEQQIAQLQAKGLIVEQVAELDKSGRPQKAQPETPGRGTWLEGKARLTAYSTRPFEVSDAVDLTKPNVYLLQLDGPILEDWKNKLQTIGVELLNAYGNEFYSAFLDPYQVQKVGTLDFVAHMMLYDGRQTAPGAVASLKPLGHLPPQSGAPVMKKTYYDVSLHRAKDLT